MGSSSVTSTDSPDGARRSRSRRVVRPAGTVGGDDANLLSTHPALAGGTSDAGPASSAPATPGPEPVVATRSVDDTDVGWGDRDGSSNDDRLSQDKPPHW